MEKRASRFNYNYSVFCRRVQFSREGCGDCRGIDSGRKHPSGGRGRGGVRGFAAQDGKGSDPGFRPKEESGSLHELRAGEAFPKAEHRASASAHHGQLSARFLLEPVSGCGDPQILLEDGGLQIVPDRPPGRSAALVSRERLPGIGLVGPRSGNGKSREEEEPMLRTEPWLRGDDLPSAAAERRLAGEKEGNVAAQGGGQR